MVILTDPQGVVLYSLGSGRFAGEAARVALRPGAAWSEGAAGTNAIGTALAERHAISVSGGEHFFDMHRILSCSAAPLFGSSGEIAGILDLTQPSDVPQTYTLALVNRAVEQIENRMFTDRFRGHEQMHFHSDPYLIGSSHEGMLAFDDGRIAGANRKGVALLGLGVPLLGRNFDEVFTLEQGSVNTNPASEDCVLRTKEGKTLFARLRPQGHVHSGWSPAGALAAGSHGLAGNGGPIAAAADRCPDLERAFGTPARCAACEGGPAHIRGGRGKSCVAGPAHGSQRAGSGASRRARGRS